MGGGASKGMEVRGRTGNGAVNPHSELLGSSSLFPPVPK